MPSVFEVLSRDHKEVTQLLAELESGPTAATGASPDQLAQRKKMAETLVIEESRHEAAEEKHFWPMVRERMPHGGQLADQAISQEQEGKEVLANLDKSNADDPDFEALLSEFIGAGRDHIAFEENQVWPGLRACLTEAQASELGRKIEHAKKTGPTRPHPRTPAAPGVLKSAGPVAAAADRAREAMTVRGT
jgi:hemerythrin superfamily protein